MLRHTSPDETSLSVESHLQFDHLHQQRQENLENQSAHGKRLHLVRLQHFHWHPHREQKGRKIRDLSRLQMHLVFLEGHRPLSHSHLTTLPSYTGHGIHHKSPILQPHHHKYHPIENWTSHLPTHFLSIPENEGHCAPIHKHSIVHQH